MKWDSDLDADSVESAETGGAVYEGEIPPAGVMTFDIQKLTMIKKNSNGNPMLKIFMLADGGPTKATKKYAGCPIWDQIVVVKQNDFRVKAFCAAVGISPKDFFAPVVNPEDDSITKFGSKSTAGLKVKILVKRGKNQTDEMRAEVNRFLPLGEASKAADDEDDDDEPDEKPAKAGKAVKAGKGKGKKAKDDEPPF